LAAASASLASETAFSAVALVAFSLLLPPSAGGGAPALDGAGLVDGSAAAAAGPFLVFLATFGSA